ncbi:MAG TPA: phenylalanine--tRNA ligase subunit alpha, partial [Parachlamydiaceae bacterium]|nr:phenylalanine--tRNA ligase subunit alpha [Parachlamydiaceae bacterium]
MQNSIDSLKDEFESEIGVICSLAELEHAKVKYLGKKGPIQNLMR